MGVYNKVATNNTFRQSLVALRMYLRSTSWLEAHITPRLTSVNIYTTLLVLRVVSSAGSLDILVEVENVSSNMVAHHLADLLPIENSEVRALKFDFANLYIFTGSAVPMVKVVMSKYFQNVQPA